MTAPISKQLSNFSHLPNCAMAVSHPAGSCFDVLVWSADSTKCVAFFFCSWRWQELFIHDAAARLSNDAERERLDQVRRSLDRLDTALLRLDENLMFFNTF